MRILCRQISTLLVTGVTACAASCASTPGPRTAVDVAGASCDAAGVAQRYSQWLKTTGLADVVSVLPDPAKSVLVLQVSDAYPALRRKADERRLDLDQSLFVQLGRLTCPGGPRQIAIRGPDPSDHLDIYEEADGAPIAVAKRYRGEGDVELSPTAINALKFAPTAGRVLSNDGWVAMPILAQHLRDAFAGKGKFALIKSDSRQLKFTVKEMRNEILAGEDWWEWLDLSVWIDPPQLEGTDSKPPAPVLLHWQANAWFGAGLRPPPGRAGYPKDMEPDHQKELVDYVDKTLLRVRDSLAPPG